MLFDLRGRGRRRTVQVIYLGLALLFLLGFIGFGVGVGGGGGGLFNALTENNGAKSASFAAKVAAAQKLTKKEPSNPKAWKALTEAQLHQAGEEAYFSPTTEQYTSKGKEYLNQVSRSWNTYLTLEPHNPSTSLAGQMLSVYEENGLNQPADEVKALQIVIPSRPPSATLYLSLAVASYKSHNANQGDLAAKKAESLAPKAQRKQVEKYLAAIKKNPSISAAAAASSATSGSGTSPSGTYTTTVNGKKTVLKASGTATAPAHTSSTGTGTTSTKK
jgi:hypothetical protein